MNQIPPRKTVVPSGLRTERSQKAVAVGTPRYNTAPLKTVVGSTARPPIKDVVGSANKPMRKDIVGSTAAPPLKTTPANLGTGAKRPLGMAAADRGAINAGNPSTQPRSVTNGNLGRSVASIPPPASGPPNPVLSWEQPQHFDGIVAGGMGQTKQNMRPRLARRRAGSKTNSSNQFYGE